MNQQQRVGAIHAAAMVCAAVVMLFQAGIPVGLLGLWTGPWYFPFSVAAAASSAIFIHSGGESQDLFTFIAVFVVQEKNQKS